MFGLLEISRITIDQLFSRELRQGEEHLDGAQWGDCIPTATNQCPPCRGTPQDLGLLDQLRRIDRTHA